MKNKDSVKWIISVFKRFFPLIFVLSFITALGSFISVALIWLSKLILDDAQNKAVGAVLLRHIIIFVALLLFQIVLSCLGGLLKLKTDVKMDMHVKNRLFEQIVAKDYSKISRIHSGELVNRFSSDVDVVVAGIGTIIPSAIGLITKLIAGVIAVYILDPIVATIIVALGFFLPLGGRVLSKKFKALHKQAQQSNGVVRSFLQESIQNIVVIKTFVANNPVKKKLRSYLEENYKIKMKRGFFSLGLNTALQSTFTFGYYGVLIWGALNIATGAITYGTLMAFLQLVSQLRNPLQGVSGLLPQYYATLASAERLIEIENYDDEEAPQKHELEGLYESLNSIDASALRFGYDDESIICDSDFSIKKGSVCALIGESGTGKSTIFRLLLALYKPCGGSLSLNTENGNIDITAVHRGLFAYVPQGDLVLSGTIRENIAFLSESATDEEIEKATKQAVIYDFIMSLPDGFETVIGERGLGLSEGQLQRIAIARALLRNSPILLLDECTSALDVDTELKLLENLKSEEDKTVILITHRMAVLDICDTVLTLKDGKIAEGKPQEW